MKRIVLAVAFAVLTTTTPVLAQTDGVVEEFKACVAETNQACLWSLGDQLTEAGSDVDAAAGMLDSLTLCLTNPTPGCAERIKAQADQQSAMSENNPVAAALRDVCVAEPTPECLITFAMAYSNTLLGGNRGTIAQIVPFVTGGEIVLSTGSARVVSSGALSGANLDYVRWLLSTGDTAGVKTFLPKAALLPAERITAEKLLAITLAKAGDINGAFEIASPLFVLDKDWMDRFEMVAQIMEAYAVLSPPDAAATVEALTGQTDNTAGFAGLALYHAKNGQPAEAKAAFDKAMAGIAISFDPGSRADGYTYLAEELARAGAFDLSRAALEQLIPDGGFTLDYPTREVAAEMARAGRQEDGLALLKELSPDHSDTSYFLMAAALGQTDAAAARAFVAGLPAGEFQIAGAQGYAQSMFQSGDAADGTAALAEFGSEFNDSPRFQTSIPTFAAALADHGQVDEALALAANDRFDVTALAFAAIALELKGGDWDAVVDLADWD